MDDVDWVEVSVEWEPDDEGWTPTITQKVPKHLVEWAAGFAAESWTDPVSAWLEDIWNHQVISWEA